MTINATVIGFAPARSCLEYAQTFWRDRTAKLKLRLGGPENLRCSAVSQVGSGQSVGKQSGEGEYISSASDRGADRRRHWFIRIV